MPPASPSSKRQEAKASGSATDHRRSMVSQVATCRCGSAPYVARAMDGHATDAPASRLRKSHLRMSGAAYTAEGGELGSQRDSNADRTWRARVAPSGRLPFELYSTRPWLKQFVGGNRTVDLLIHS